MCPASVGVWCGEPATPGRLSGVATPSTPQQDGPRSSADGPGATKLRSPLMRALLPNLGGLLVIGLIGLMLWGFAAYISGDDTAPSERLAPTSLQVGSAQNAASIVDDDGPIIFPGLGTTTGERTIVLDHTGDDPATGWVVYFAHPADRDPSCAVEQVIGTRQFIDCDGNTIDVTDLAPPPPGVNPVVENERQLSIDLTGITTTD